MVSPVRVVASNTASDKQRLSHIGFHKSRRFFRRLFFILTRVPIAPGLKAKNHSETHYRRGKRRLTPTSNLRAIEDPDGSDGNTTINRIPKTSRVPPHLDRNAYEGVVWV